MLLGEMYGLMAACSWAIAVVIYKNNVKDMGPNLLNLTKGFITVLILSPIFFFKY